MKPTGKYGNLLLNTLLFAINSVATKFVVFILVPLYTTYMSAAEYGLADMSASVIQLVTPLATLSITDAVLRYMVDDESRRGTYALAGLVITLFSTGLVGIGTPFLKLGFFGGLGNYPVWFILAYSSNALLLYCSNVARGLNRVRVIPICAGFSSLTTIVLAYLLIGRLGMSVIGYFISVSAGPMMAVVAYLLFGGILGAIKEGFIELRRDATACASFKQALRPMLLYSLPLVPNSLFWWASTGINRFFITGMIGISASGLYAAASKIPTLINAAYAVFQQAWQLSSFQESKHDDIADFYKTVFTLVQAGMSVLCAAICCTAPIIGYIMLKGETYQSWPMIGLLVFANFMNVLNSFYGTIYTSTMNTSHIMMTTVFGAITCTALTPLLINPLGIRGACLASAAGQSLVFFIRVLQSKKLIDFDPNWRILAPTIILLLIQSVYVGFQLTGWSLVSALFLFLIALAQGRNVVQLLATRRKRR